jgi:hypothetical protein
MSSGMTAQHITGPTPSPSSSPGPKLVTARAGRAGRAGRAIKQHHVCLCEVYL